jgi:hypothetical protein
MHEPTAGGAVYYSPTNRMLARSLTIVQQAVAQRPPIRLRRKARKELRRRSGSEEMGLHGARARQDNMGGRPAEARDELS